MDFNFWEELSVECVVEQLGFELYLLCLGRGYCCVHMYSKFFSKYVEGHGCGGYGACLGAKFWEI